MCRWGYVDVNSASNTEREAQGLGAPAGIATERQAQEPRPIQQKTVSVGAEEEAPCHSRRMREEVICFPPLYIREVKGWAGVAPDDARCTIGGKTGPNSAGLVSQERGRKSH